MIRTDCELLYVNRTVDFDINQRDFEPGFKIGFDMIFIFSATYPTAPHILNIVKQPQNNVPR